MRRFAPLLAAAAFALAAPATALAAPLTESLVKLRSVSRVPLMAGWKSHLGELPAAASPAFDDGAWPVAKPDAKGNIGWPKGRRVLWLRQWVTIPRAWRGYASAGTRAHLSLIWWAEKAEIYIDGRFVQAGDLYDAVQRVPVTAAARPGERFLIALKLTSPGHDLGALSQARLDIAAPAGRTDPGLLADELEVVDGYLQEIATPPERRQWRPALDQALAALDWRALAGRDQARFEKSLTRARERLAPTAQLTRARTIALLGHSHIDMAWLWTVPETKAVIERTFRSALGLMEDHPRLDFAQSTAQSYQWLERERPQLFEAIRQRVDDGRWELVGGMWVEPDLNLPDGESLIRQVLYGKQYFQSRFGRDIRVGWNPDAFGYTWQLPQIYKKSGIDYFLTTKLDWNDTTQFPHRIFWWQGPDGSKILTYFSNLLGAQIEAVPMAKKARAYEKDTGYPKLMWIYGVGDHGGGPTRDMLDQAERLASSPVYPKIEKTTALAYLEQLAAADPKARRFPTWNSELYLEFHRGTFTTHAGQKQKNRRMEVTLAEAEKFSAAGKVLQSTAYPAAELEAIWKKVLFNQFHDILPGSAIPAVYEQADREWREAQDAGEDLRTGALRALAAQADTQGAGLPVVVFNSLATPRDAPVALPAPDNLRGAQLVAVDRTGKSVPIQAEGEWLHFWAAGVPGIGHKVFWLRPADAPAPAMAGLENAYLRVEVDPRTGDLASIFDKRTGRETLNGPGNQLQFFKDAGQYWDAWNIDPDYEKHPLEAPTLVALQTVEQGPVRTVVRVVRRFRQSTFEQDLILYREAPHLEIANRVDWQERHVFVKAAFPLAVRSEQATYEIPFATIERSTLRDTPARKAQWEVPALRWADVADARSGVSLLNDSKYGHDARRTDTGTLLRLSLLRGPEWPDPKADLGEHAFRYALYPHPGDWRTAATVQAGLDLNTPLHALPETAHPGTLPESFLQLNNPQVVVAAWKQAEDGKGWILRLYESQGRPAAARLRLAIPVRSVVKTDLLERPIAALAVQDGQASLQLGPYEIQTIRVQF
ncbi:MAG: alpha-mannosidase [Aphanocapsa lilacina HA4352-LM1]|nr:alpha-mannosidase [Aphanocapsa lilacina HA4352-LM1]